MFSRKLTLPKDPSAGRVHFRVQSVNWPGEDSARFLNLDIYWLVTCGVDHSCQQFVEPIHEFFLNSEGGLAYFLMAQRAI